MGKFVPVTKQTLTFSCCCHWCNDDLLWFYSVDSGGRSGVEDRPGRLHSGAFSTWSTSRRRLNGTFHVGPASLSVSVFLCICGTAKIADLYSELTVTDLIYRSCCLYYDWNHTWSQFTSQNVTISLYPYIWKCQFENVTTNMASIQTISVVFRGPLGDAAFGRTIIL